MSSETFPEKIDALSLRTNAIKCSNRLVKNSMYYSFYVEFSYVRPIFVIVCFRKLLGERGWYRKYWMFWGRELETSRYVGFSEYMKFVY